MVVRDVTHKMLDLRWKGRFDRPGEVAALDPKGALGVHCTMVMLAALLKLMVLLWRNGMIRG